MGPSMQSLIIIYSALAVFGVGVTIVDLFGVFEHAGAHDAASGGSDAASADSTDGDAAAGSGHGDALGHGGGADASGHDGGSHDGQADPGEASHHGGLHAHDLASHGGSYVASAESGTRAVAKAIGVLRSGVYFSLGAGLTGLFSLLTKVSTGAGLLWSAGAGVFIAVLARTLRAFIRKDLDSSIKPEEFIMDEASVTVPIAPGALGKVLVRRYGVETELYARAKDPALFLARGTSVRIVDWDEDCYWVEAQP